MMMLFIEGLDNLILLKYRLRKTNFQNKNLLIFTYPSVLIFVLGAQKNHLIEMVHLSTTTYVLVEK